MKLTLLLISLMVGGCACCGPDEPIYKDLPPIVKVNERYIPIPEILIDGADLPIVKEDNLWTFSGEATDSSTGKKVELSGVVDTVARKILYTVHVKKDSVKVQDSTKTIKQVPIVQDKPLAWYEKIGNYTIAIIVLLIILAIIWRMKK